MNPQTVNAALQFLNRVSLAPAEIPAYVAVVNALKALPPPKVKKPRPVKPAPSTDGKDSPPVS